MAVYSDIVDKKLTLKWGYQKKNLSIIHSNYIADGNKITLLPLWVGYKMKYINIGYLNSIHFRVLMNLGTGDETLICNFLLTKSSSSHKTITGLEQTILKVNYNILVILLWEDAIEKRFRSHLQGPQWPMMEQSEHKIE